MPVINVKHLRHEINIKHVRPVINLKYLKYEKYINHVRHVIKIVISIYSQ